MAQIGDSGDSSNPNVELNLVPFIDLMCVCITFLLVTAVWTQISMIELGTSVYGKNAGEQDASPKQDYIAFRLDIKPNGFIINIGLQVIQVPMVNGKYDKRTLSEEIKKSVRTKYPEKKDAVIAMSDELSYETMIKGMDVLIAEGFTDIGIATGEVR